MVLLILAALVGVLLALGVLEPQIAANVHRANQALGLAEAGAERTIAHFIADSSAVQCAMATVDDGCATPTPSSTTTLFSGVNLDNLGTYTVTYRPVSFATLLIESTGQTSIGSAQRMVRVVVTKHHISKFAVLGDDVEVTGNASVAGNAGAVHGNASTEVSGSASIQKTATSSGSTCAGCIDSGLVGEPGASGPGKPVEPIPNVTAGTVRGRATIVMGGREFSGGNPPPNTGGTYTTATCGGVTIQVYEHEVLNRVAVGNLPACAITNLTNPNNPTFFSTAGGSQRTELTGPTNPYAGWSMNGPGQWRTSSGGPDGIYYANDRIEIQGGGTSSTPWKATFIAGGTDKEQGRVEMSGNPVIKPFSNDPELLIIAGEVKLTGTPVLSGVIFATGTGGSTGNAGDLDISGNVQLTGNVISNGEVKITGSAGGGGAGPSKITYNIGTRTRFISPTLRILSWSTVTQ